MRKVKFIIATVILLWSSSINTAYAQETTKPGSNIPALKELVPLDPFKLTPQQGQSFNPTLGKGIYFEDGTSLTGDQFAEKIQNAGYIPIPYVKKEDPNTVVAMLVRKATDEEKEAIKGMMAAMSGGEENLGDGGDVNNPELMKPIEFDPNTKYGEFTNGLRKIVQKPGEPRKLRSSAMNPTRVAFFNPDGKFIIALPKDDKEAAKYRGLTKELTEYLDNPKDWVQGEIFVDEKNVIKAIKFRKATMEERKNAPSIAFAGGAVDDAGSMTSGSAKLDTKYESNSLEKKLVGSKAPEIDTKDVNGNPFNLAKAKGKVVVLNFWFIQCAPCKIEIPELNKLVDEYKGKDVEFIAVANNDKASLIKFLQTTAYQYRIIPDGLPIANKWGVSGFPTNVVIDKKGKVVFLQTALGDNLVPEMKQKIEEALKK